MNELDERQIESDFLYALGTFIEKRTTADNPTVASITDFDIDALRTFFRKGWVIGAQRRDGVAVGLVSHA